MVKPSKIQAEELAKLRDFCNRSNDVNGRLE